MLVKVCVFMVPEVISNHVIFTVYLHRDSKLARTEGSGPFWGLYLVKEHQ